MSKPTAAIIEDEVPAARLLSTTLKRLRPEWEIIVLPGSVEEAIAWFGTHTHPDILFLDIQMKGMDGMETAMTNTPSVLSL